jgi:hypothetical protein
MPNDRLSLQPVTSPPRKKSRSTFGSPDNDLEEDEKQTCSNEIRGKGREQLEATIMQGNIKEKPKPNLDKVIDNIQAEHVVFIEHVVSITNFVAIATKSFQHVQTEVEPLQIENPLFLKFQLGLVFCHSTKTLRHINMFLKQVAQNATT